MREAGSRCVGRTGTRYSGPFPGVSVYAQMQNKKAAIRGQEKRETGRRDSRALSFAVNTRTQTSGKETRGVDRFSRRIECTR